MWKEPKNLGIFYGNILFSNLKYFLCIFTHISAYIQIDASIPKNGFPFFLLYACIMSTYTFHQEYENIPSLD